MSRHAAIQLHKYQQKWFSDRTLWEREYLCKFVVGTDAWFPPELVQPCLDEFAENPEAYTGRATYIGVDIGWGNDLWVAWALERTDSGILWTREISVIEPDADINNRFTIQDRELDRLVAKYDTRKISIDATGIGKKPVEDAIKRYGEWRVQGIDMTNTAQYELATGGRQAMESKLVKIPRDRATLKDLDKIRHTITPTGKISFRAQRDKEGHADRSWAYMLAIQAAQLPELIFPEFGSDTDHIDPHNNTLDWMF
jgi:phage FluMu gp28-like protein